MIPCLCPGGLSNPAYVRDLYDSSDRHPTDEDDDEQECKPIELTATERVLPWKRTDDRDQMVCQAPLKQREFPAWLKNAAYMVHGDVHSSAMGKLVAKKWPSLIFDYITSVALGAPRHTTCCRT